MDEYLFTVLAKLKADRLTLERKERQPRVEEEAIELPAHRSPRARRGQVASSELLSIVPAHGLRGWS
ncbi:MAG TPA: hypothetical protein PKE27_14650 [Povalibacter sp.]|uniref:hypothetical protein n=1 Tax=Povalibacter sp. TaxID=1962978 RepID=UPI002C01EEE4|nr:hypothetical protein [Povalibacter sp.]HMN45815.1 hypothetical protein [Povalibacter sp.]